jgi:hypothetical protein
MFLQFKSRGCNLFNAKGKWYVALSSSFIWTTVTDVWFAPPAWMMFDDEADVKFKKDFVLIPFRIWDPLVAMPI